LLRWGRRGRTEPRVCPSIVSAPYAIGVAMDAPAFDALPRAIASAGTRRWLLTRLTALPLGGMLLTSAEEEAAAERPHQRLGRRNKQRNRKQRHKRRRNKRQNQNNNQNTTTQPTGGGTSPPPRPPASATPVPASRMAV